MTLEGTTTLGVDDEDLSEERIEELLQQAEARLRGHITSGYPVPASRKNIAQTSNSQTVSLPPPPVRKEGAVARVHSASLVQDEKKGSEQPGIRKINERIPGKNKAEIRDGSAGASWYNLPKTVVTPQLKRDLQLIRMRSVLDPHRHYKKDNTRDTIPQFSQVGTMVEGPTDYFSARIPKSKRHKTLVESVMAAEKESGRMKKKYGEVQDRKASGKKGHYKRMMERRYKGKIRK